VSASKKAGLGAWPASTTWPVTARSVSCSTTTLASPWRLATVRASVFTAIAPLAAFGWAPLGWAALGWAALGWAALGWAALDWAARPPALRVNR